MPKSVLRVTEELGMDKMDCLPQFMFRAKKSKLALWESEIFADDSPLKIKYCINGLASSYLHDKHHGQFVPVSIDHIVLDAGTHTAAAHVIINFL